MERIFNDPFSFIPDKNAHNIVYRIYYGDEIVYVGRTTQPVQARMHNHFHKTPPNRVIDICKVSRIEFANLPTEADMYIYEVYYINKLHPRLNTDAKGMDKPTVELPEPEWIKFTTYLWDKWLRENEEIDIEWAKKQQAKELKRKIKTA